MKDNDNTKFGLGPLQIVHDFKFVALNVKDDYSVLDTLSYGEKAEYIKSRIDRLHRLGYGGVVMNVDSKGYLKKPEDFELFFECAEYAKSLGLRVWIYDEQYYPSGAAGGLVLVDHPELEALALACVREDFVVDDSVGAIRVPSPYGYSELKYAVAAPIRGGEVVHGERLIVSERRDLAGGLCFHAEPGEWRVWCFFQRPLYEQTYFSQGTRASRRYISVFNKKAVERFYQVTFEDGYNAYADGRLSRIVDAVFTDEPYSPFYKKYEKSSAPANRTHMASVSIYDEPKSEVRIFPYVPWETSLPDRFFVKYGRNIEDTLPDIFDETPATIGARIDFYSLLSEMSLEAFPRQMSDKLGGEGVLLSGHYYGEEGLDFQPIFYGDILEHLGTMGIPGCDCLWSDLEVLRYSIACRLASSAAHLTSREDVMIEASNMVDKDQNITLARAKAAISTMFAHGVTVITSYYSEHFLPDDEIIEFNAHISALSRLFKGGKNKINTLLYYPFENLCADRYPMGILEGNNNGEDHLGVARMATKLIQHQVCFDIVNKRHLLSCEFLDGYLLTPYGERVEYIVFPSVSFVDEDVARFVEKAQARGVNILFDGEKREISNVLFAKRFVFEEKMPASACNLLKCDDRVIAIRRAFDGYELLMLMNTDDKAHDVRFDSEGMGACELFLVDLLTSEETRLGAEISISIPPLEQVIIKRLI